MADTTAAATLATTTDMHLFRLREHIATVRAQRTTSADTLMACQLFEALDVALSATGVLPLDWSMAKRSLVLNGIPNQPRWAFGAPVGMTDPDEDPEDVIEV
jgi:hypothetical protein